MYAHFIIIIISVSFERLSSFVWRVYQSDFTVRCSNFSFLHATSDALIHSHKTQVAEKEIEGERERVGTSGTYTQYTYRQKGTRQRFANKSRALFRNAFDMKRDGNNLTRMHATSEFVMIHCTAIMLLGVFMRWQRQRTTTTILTTRAPDETARIGVPTTLSSLHNLKRSEGYVYTIPFYTRNTRTTNCSSSSSSISN